MHCRNIDQPNGLARATVCSASAAAQYNSPLSWLKSTVIEPGDVIAAAAGDFQGNVSNCALAARGQHRPH